MSPPDLDRLSGREEQVLGLAAEGLLDKQIAASLGVSENTLRTYWRRIRVKLGEESRTALAAIYAKGRSIEGLQDTGTWSIDLSRGVMEYRGDEDVLPRGETSLNEALMTIYPDDRERMRDLIGAMAEQESPPVTVVARVQTSRGVEAICSRIESVVSTGGKVERLIGHPVPLYDLTRNPRGAAHFGHYRRDLETGEVNVDEGLRRIFRIPEGELDLREAVLRVACPASRVKMGSQVDGMISAGRRQRRLTVKLCFPSGEQLWVAIQSRIEMRDGQPVAFSATGVAFF